MATTVRITETYDLKTTLNQLGIIGIHTPTNAQINKLYPGLAKNHRFVRFLKCDVVGACASVLPADPLQVGVEAGDVAPEDMFNPILMTACTNESFDTIVSKAYGGQNVGSLGSVSKQIIAGDNFKRYYALLSENGKWRKAMPQAGFMMRGLKPICHTLISSFGNMSPIGNKEVMAGPNGETTTLVPDLLDVKIPLNALTSEGTQSKNVVFRGKSVKMPKLPLHYGMEADGAGPQNFSVPEIYVACLVVPPARLHEFYYRMRVTWTLRFEKVISSNEFANGTYLENTAGVTYYNGINPSRAEMAIKEDTVDVSNVSIDKIMEA